MNPPIQYVVDPPIITVGFGLMVVVMFADPVHPSVSMTSTPKLPSSVTVMVCVVSPVDHVYPEKPVPASRVVPEPSQNESTPVITGVREAVSVTAKDACPVQPLISVTVTLYVPEEKTSSV